MAGNLLTKYGTNAQAIAITLASLASSIVYVGKESTAIDNRTNQFIDALVRLKIKTGASGTSATGYVAVYAYGTVDDGTTYSDGCTGSDAGKTLTNPPNCRLIGIINAVANATTYISSPMSVAAAFGGVLPAKWGIVVVNVTSGTFDTTEGNFAKEYQGVYGQYT